MNKAEFINAVAEKTEISKKDVKLMVEASLDVITETLSKKEDVTFIGFGSFSTAERKARDTKVPNTGKVVKVPATTVAKFKVGKALKDSVANKK